MRIYNFLEVNTWQYRLASTIFVVLLIWSDINGPKITRQKFQILRFGRDRDPLLRQTQNDRLLRIGWCDHLGQDYRVEVFDWVGWRGVFTLNPDGNLVELVAKNPDKVR